jgi:hypothetical protein
VTGKAPVMLPSSLLSPLGQTKIYLYAKPLDMRNYAVMVIMWSWAAGDAGGGDRARVFLCIIEGLLQDERNMANNLSGA